MSDMPIGAVLADMMSEPGKASELPPEQTTDSVLQTMLTENTGRHVLDSGGAYGRAWEKNQGVDFSDVPEMHVEWRTYEAGKYSKRDEGALEYELYATINVYHYLRDRLDFDPDMEAKFDEFCERPENEREHWLECMEKFADERHSSPHGDGHYTVNSYNHEDALSQVIQYTVFTDHEDDDTYVLLQIHGGADVRGGYTRPRVFRAYEDWPLSDNARIEVGCDGSGEPDHNPGQLDLNGDPVKVEECRANWTDEGGSSWLFDGGCPAPEGTDLGTIDVEKGTEGKKGILVIDEDENVAFCPVCGKGKLGVYPPYAGC